MHCTATFQRLCTTSLGDRNFSGLYNLMGPLECMWPITDQNTELWKLSRNFFCILLIAIVCPSSTTVTTRRNTFNFVVSVIFYFTFKSLCLFHKYLFIVLSVLKYF